MFTIKYTRQLHDMQTIQFENLKNDNNRPALVEGIVKISSICVILEVLQIIKGLKINNQIHYCTTTFSQKLVQGQIFVINKWSLLLDKR